MAKVEGRVVPMRATEKKLDDLPKKDIIKLLLAEQEKVAKQEQDIQEAIGQLSYERDDALREVGSLTLQVKRQTNMVFNLGQRLSKYEEVNIPGLSTPEATEEPGESDEQPN